MNRSAYSKEVMNEVRKDMDLIKAGKIRNHQLGNGAVTHSGELEEKERVIFCDFLPTKNCDFVCSLIGSEMYE